MLNTDLFSSCIHFRSSFYSYLMKSFLFLFRFRFLKTNRFSFSFYKMKRNHFRFYFCFHNENRSGVHACLLYGFVSVYLCLYIINSLSYCSRCDSVSIVMPSLVRHFISHKDLLLSYI